MLHRAAVLILFALCACTAAVAQRPKPTIVRDSYLIAPKTFDELWDSSTIIAKVLVERSEPFASPASQGAPHVYTRHYGRVLRVFKGQAQAGSHIDFAQTGGVLETPDYIIKDAEPRLLQVGHSYIVFIKPLVQTNLLALDYNHFGAFEIRESRVVPVAGGDVSNEWRNMAESRFADALDQLRLRRGGPSVLGVSVPDSKWRK